MKNKRFPLLLVGIALGTLVVFYVLLFALSATNRKLDAESIPVKPVSSEISADGSVHSENEATLHFPIAGKLTYLPFKQGDSVLQGQTIAMLDERVIEKNLQSAVDSYKSQKNSFDTVNDFNGDRPLSDTGLSTSALRQLTTAANTLDQAALAVDIAQIAQEQATLTSPLNGIITGEDVTVANQNVTTLTSFSVADPTQPVFQAFILPQDIDFIQVGSIAKITLDGNSGIVMQGTIERIYPQKVTLTNGMQGYYVDITSPELKNIAKLGQTGSVLIDSIARGNNMLVPVWAVVGHNYIWILENGKAVLKKVTVGSIHGDQIVVSGLNLGEKVILNPEDLVRKNYKLL